MTNMIHLDVLEECHLPGGTVVHLRGVLTYYVDPPMFPSYAWGDDPGNPGSRPELSDGELELGTPLDADCELWTSITLENARLLLSSERLEALADEAERQALGVLA